MMIKLIKHLRVRNTLAIINNYNTPTNNFEGLNFHIDSQTLILIITKQKNFCCSVVKKYLFKKVEPT